MLLCYLGTLAPFGVGRRAQSGICPNRSTGENIILEFLISIPSAQVGTMVKGDKKGADLRSAEHVELRVTSHHEY